MLNGEGGCWRRRDQNVSIIPPILINFPSSGHGSNMDGGGGLVEGAIIMFNISIAQGLMEGAYWRKSN